MRKRRRFTPEFKPQIVRLVREGKAVAREHDLMRGSVSQCDVAPSEWCTA